VVVTQGVHHLEAFEEALSSGHGLQSPERIAADPGSPRGCAR
jgi:hypothetical protein